MFEHVSADELAEIRERARGLRIGEPVTGCGLGEHTGLIRSTDKMRAVAEVDHARWIGSVAATGAHHDDGHTTVAAWCRASCRWSETKASSADRPRTGRGSGRGDQ